MLVAGGHLRTGRDNPAVMVGSDFLKLIFNYVHEQLSDVVSVWGSLSPLNKGGQASTLHYI